MLNNNSKRKHQRIAYDEALNFSLAVVKFKSIEKVHSTGKAIDISDGGIGFYTDYPLEPGHILRIEHGPALSDTAMVKWVIKSENGFRAGAVLYR
ncbi:MAG: PilZ domain-containing protein [Nitrospiraceae bacterium]|nr:MAG: PilZ domain-containing protein [Nitrospiraceae bacterium]